MIQRPVAVGLTICELAIVEERTRNITLVNSFTRLKVRGFPSLPRPLVVCVTLTDGLGEGAINLVVNRLDTFEEVYSHVRQVIFTDPLLEVRILFRLNDCSFPAPGQYQFALSADNELVAQRSIHLSLIGDQ
jgi:hypothetical protein